MYWHEPEPNTSRMLALLRPQEGSEVKSFHSNKNGDARGEHASKLTMLEVILNTGLCEDFKYMVT